jgi:hypothetical protein
MTYLNDKQIEQLLEPINPARVLDLRGMSYVSQHDVRAHMNRIFGFANWSTDVIETAFLFENPDPKTGRWRVGYRATVKVTVHSPEGDVLAHYTDSHAGSCAPQPDLGDAHGLALTSVVSTAFKRACTNLGDQFGLSLYEKGSRKAIVRGTLVGTSTPDVPEVAVEHGDEDGAVRNTEPEGDDAHAPMLEALRALWVEEDSSQRILGIAAFKTEYADRLDDTTEFQGEPITFNALADKIATNAMKVTQ